MESPELYGEQLPPELYEHIPPPGLQGAVHWHSTEVVVDEQSEEFTFGGVLQDTVPPLGQVTSAEQPPAASARPVRTATTKLRTNAITPSFNLIEEIFIREPPKMKQPEPGENTTSRHVRFAVG